MDRRGEQYTWWVARWPEKEWPWEWFMRAPWKTPVGDAGLEHLGHTYIRVPAKKDTCLENPAKGRGGVTRITLPS